MLDVEAPEQSATSGELIVEVEEELNISEINLTEINATETNITLIENVSAYALTQEELTTLQIKTGATKVEITKAEVINNRLIIRFEIGNYWLENSYDNSVSEDEIKAQIELDRVKWVKRLAQKLSETEKEVESVEGLVGEYEL